MMLGSELDMASGCKNPSEMTGSEGGYDTR